MIQRIDTPPIYKLTEEAQKAKQIRELSLEREWLVKERSRLKNQLHILLHCVHNTGSEQSSKTRSPRKPCGIGCVQFRETPLQSLRNEPSEPCVASLICEKKFKRFCNILELFGWRFHPYRKLNSAYNIPRVYLRVCYTAFVNQNTVQTNNVFFFSFTKNLRELIFVL